MKLNTKKLNNYFRSALNSPEMKEFVREASIVWLSGSTDVSKSHRYWMLLLDLGILERDERKKK